MAKGLEHMLLSIQKPFLQVDVAFIPVAITKFTDQSKVAHNANKIPFFLVIFLNSKI
jgi:hypothetical protein